MARKINRLTARAVATITENGRHADGGGLYLKLSPNGGRRWVFLFRWHGKPTEIWLRWQSSAWGGAVLLQPRHAG
jgi:hypothetical protein